MTIRVVLADDQPLIRAGLSMVIADTPDIEIVGEAGTGAEAVRLVRELGPDVALMDIRMPGMDGIEATRLITSDQAVTTRVLVLTTFDDDDNVYAALRAGASGFLVKDMALDDILAATRVVAAGDALIAPSVTRRLIAEFADRPEPAAPAALAAPTAPTTPTALATPTAPTAPPIPGLESVTEREREVLTLVGRGLSNAEIAARLFIGPGTAKTHVARLLTKLDARDRVQLVITAYEAGLVSPSR
ncbi:response regulator [Kitasatospora sp. NPDC058170]|uniref:response regulator n=1 Tax=Kitasatospora sp. NPDC058170 TaxID=3346364 RepID=UPI0036DC62D6